MSLLVAFAITANVFTVYTLITFAISLEALEALPEVLSAIILGALTLSVFLSIACIVFACGMHNQAASDPQAQRGLFVPVLVIKLIMIPFYILVAVIAFFMIFASALLTLSIHLASMGLLMGIFSVIFIPLMFVVCLLYVFATSSFSISAILIQRRKNAISRGMATVFIILQILPVVDAISYIFFVAKFSRVPVDMKPLNR